MAYNRNTPPRDEITLLFEVVQKNKITLIQLSKESGFSTATLSNWKIDRCKPNAINFNMLKAALQRLLQELKNNK